MCQTCGGTGTVEQRFQEESADGSAAWWTTERVYSATVDLPIGDTSVEISVRAEVPMSAENYRVHRRGNRYWPTTVRVELDDADLDLLPQTARELAQRLVEAADAADAIDNPDTDTCGHWAPCDCGGASAESHAGKETPMPDETGRPAMPDEMRAEVLEAMAQR